MPESEIANELIKTASKIENDPTDITPLRNLQWHLEHSIYYERNEDLIFLRYFVIQFTDDILYNIVDSTIEIPLENRIQLFKEVGETLNSLGKLVEKADFSNCYSVYTKIVKSYLTKIKEMEDIVQVI